jgi:cytochrome P450
MPEDGWVEVSGYAEAAEVLRSPNVIMAGGPSDPYFRTGGLTRIDGAVHNQRRRTTSSLLKMDRHARFRESVLRPAVARSIGELRAVAEPGGPGADLVTFGFRVFTELTAAVIGLETMGRLDDLVDINRRLHGAGDSNLEALHGTPPQALLDEAIAATERLRRDHYEPSLAAHQAILAEVEAGTRSGDSLPHDLLMLIATRADGHWEDPDVAFREASSFFRAGINTSTQALAFVADELWRWLDAHPEDVPRAADPELLVGVVEESLRLHPVAPELLRLARERLVLSTGRIIEAGGAIAVQVAAANRDPAVFGPDAEAFDPHRSFAKGVYPYGLAFSTGPHMCFGLPLVMGRQGSDGTLVHTLGELLRAGMHRDPERPPEKRVGTHKDVFLTYPILMGAMPG